MRVAPGAHGRAGPRWAGLGCRRARERGECLSGTVVLGKWKQGRGPGAEGCAFCANTDALIRGSWGVRGFSFGHW